MEKFPGGSDTSRRERRHEVAGGDTSSILDSLERARVVLRKFLKFLGLRGYFEGEVSHRTSGISRIATFLGSDSPRRQRRHEFAWKDTSSCLVSL